MNMFKKNGGFTLVELIVVIAILAILAGVAVPAYSGYISKANEASDMTQLDAIKTAAVFAATEKDVNCTVTKIVVTAATKDAAGTVKVDYTTTTDANADGTPDNGTGVDVTSAVKILFGENMWCHLMCPCCSSGESQFNADWFKWGRDGQVRATALLVWLYST